MKPWFIREGDVIKFPDPSEKKIVRLPTIDQYPSFIDGVMDLQAQLDDGRISRKIYDKLYTDLIHRWAKKEGMEPWFLKEYDPIGKEKLQKLNRIINKLKTDPELIDQIFNQMSAKVKDIEGQFVSRFAQMLDPKLTAPEKDQSFGDFLKSFAEIISETEGTNEEKFQFVNTLGKVSHIDTNKLLQPLANWDDWLVGTPFSQKLFDKCFNDPRLRTNLKGPGEAALALLSPNIKLLPSAGDLDIAGKKVEVKGGNTSKGGRLTPTENVVGQVDAKWIRKNIFANNKKAIIPSSTSHLNFVNTLVIPNNMNAEQVNTLLSTIFQHPKLKTEIEEISKRTSKIVPADLFKLGLLNYAYAQGDDSYLILTRDVRKSIYFNISNWAEVYQNVAVSFAITGTDKRSVGLPQLGVRTKTV